MRKGWGPGRVLFWRDIQWIGLAWIASIVAHRTGIGGIGGLAAVCLVLGALQWNRARSLRRGIATRQDELWVRVAYRSDGHDDALHLGSDEGFLGVVDGWLRFRGERTQWSLARKDARAKGFLIEVPDAAGKLVMKLTPRDGRLTRLREWLDSWSAGQRAEGVPLLPARDSDRKIPWLRWSDAARVPSLATWTLIVGIAGTQFSWLDNPSIVKGLVYGPILLSMYEFGKAIRGRLRRWRSWRASSDKSLRPAPPAISSDPTLDAVP